MAEPAAMRSAPSSVPEIARLGVALASAGALVKIAMGLAALTALAGALVAFAVRHDGAEPPLAEVIAATSAALAWGAGVLAAFAASTHALRDDRAHGVRALLRHRGASRMAYLGGRIAGVAALLLVIVLGGALVAGLGALAAAPHDAVARTAQGLGASAVYALGFAITVAPLAVAALGARTRGGGYAALLLFLVVPQLLRPWTAPLVSPPWRPLLALPSALGALRASLMPPGSDVAALARAALVLTLVAAVCVAIARAELARVDAAPKEPPR